MTTTYLTLNEIRTIGFEALLREEIPVQRLDRFLPRGSGADPVLYFLRHLIELSGIRVDREGGIGIAGDQKGALLEIRHTIRPLRQLLEFILETSATDFLKHRDKTVAHFRLFDFCFLQQGDC